MPFLISAIALLSVSLMAVGCGPVGPSDGTLVFPREGIASPYDFAGVRAALAERAVTLSAPTDDEATRAAPPPAFLATLQPIVVAENARIVSIHLAIVDKDDPHLTIDHALAYIVETTDHATGNCITAYDAVENRALFGSCFYSDRTHP